MSAEKNAGRHYISLSVSTSPVPDDLDYDGRIPSFLSFISHGGQKTPHRQICRFSRGMPVRVCLGADTWHVIHEKRLLAKYVHFLFGQPLLKAFHHKTTRMMSGVLKAPALSYVVSPPYYSHSNIRQLFSIELEASLI